LNVLKDRKQSAVYGAAVIPGKACGDIHPVWARHAISASGAGHLDFLGEYGLYLFKALKLPI